MSERLTQELDMSSGNRGGVSPPRAGRAPPNTRSPLALETLAPARPKGKELGAPGEGTSSLSSATTRRGNRRPAGSPRAGLRPTCPRGETLGSCAGGAAFPSRELPGAGAAPNSPLIPALDRQPPGAGLRGSRRQDQLLSHGHRGRSAVRFCHLSHSLHSCRSSNSLGSG